MIVMKKVVRKFKKKNFVILLSITLFFLLMNFYCFYEFFGYKIQNNLDIGIIYNENPIIKYHASEFNIKTSVYYEKNYERYINYKKENSNLTDDEIINYVNIGLDNDFYTNIRDSNLDDGIFILCNKYNKLSQNYVPELVNINSKYTSSGGKLHPVAYEAFKEMVDNASLDGIKLYNVSAYRSYWTQSYLYNNYKNRDGVLKADTYSARAGYSEHQTGLATDINTASSSAHFENTKEYAWLMENCYKYGFILRYPKGKEYITGYKYEPWHYRYVGVEVATYIHENDITYEEYYANFLERQ